MTQEDRELLLKDLSARLSYQPLCKKVDTEDDFCECDAPLGYSLRDLVDNKIIIKPYLRLMSRMTQEERKELYKIIGWNDENENGWIRCDNIHTKYGISLFGINKLIDWLNAHHFDYRGLLVKGLAIQVTKENNPYKE